MKHSRKFRIAAMTAAILLLSAAMVFADDTDWYTNNAYLLTNNSIILTALRTIGWYITLGLCLASEGLWTLYDVTFNAIDITKYGPVNDLITSFRGVLIALMVLGFAYLGIHTILNPSYKPPLVRNLVLGMLAVTVSLSAFNALNAMAMGFKDDVLGGDSRASVDAYDLVDSNIFDLVRMDKQGNIANLNYTKLKAPFKAGAGISDSSTISRVNINETLNFKDAEEGKNLYNWSDSFDSYIQKKLAFGPEGENSTTPVYDGVLFSTIGNEFYYRYKFTFVTCWMELIAYIIMLIALSYKNVRIGYELVNARILAYLHAADITSGERLKQILLFIRDTYIVLGISVLSVKLYAVLTKWLTESLNASGIGGGLLKGIISLFIAFCVIDGPNIAERILGMDAGLGRSWARTMGAFEVARGAARGMSRLFGGKGGRSGGRPDNGGGDGDSGHSAVSDMTAQGGSNKGDKAVDAMDKASEENSAQDKDKEAPKTSGNKAEPGGQTNSSSEAAKNALDGAGAEGADDSGQAQEPVGVESSAPEFMDQSGNGGGTGSPDVPESTDRMTVDFMEKGRAPEQPKTEHIPDRKPVTNSSFTATNPAQALNNAGGKKSGERKVIIDQNNTMSSNKPDSGDTADGSTT